MSEIPQAQSFAGLRQTMRDREPQQISTFDRIRQQQMDISKAFQRDSHRRLADGRAIWIAVVVAGGIGSSLFFACATPFAALATLAAIRMEKRDALVTVGLVWLANQMIGYSVLGYPWTLVSAAWGIMIGVAVFLALLTATGLSPTRSAPLTISLPFIGAFATYELALYVASYVLPGGASGFTAQVVEQIFIVNLIALASLLAAHQLALTTGLLSREDAPDGMAPALQ